MDDSYSFLHSFHNSKDTVKSEVDLNSSGKTMWELTVILKTSKNGENSMKTRPWVFTYFSRKQRLQCFLVICNCSHRDLTLGTFILGQFFVRRYQSQSKTSNGVSEQCPSDAGLHASSNASEWVEYGRFSYGGESLF